MLKRLLSLAAVLGLVASTAGCGGAAARGPAEGTGPALVERPSCECGDCCPEVAGAAPAGADAPAERPEAQTPAASGEAAATATPERVAELVKQLGHESFEKREAATRELARVGKPALPALEEARKSSDPEVALRAERLTAEIEGRAKEASAPDMPSTAQALRGIRVGGAHGGMRLQLGNGIQVIGGQVNFQRTRTVSTEEGTATITESNEGITLLLKPKEGEAKTFQAESKEAFKEKFPKLYKQYVDPNG